jgi:tetratricopeptide (TPR) repeat protein
MEAGHYALMKLKDFERARGYFKTAMEIPGAPPMARRLYANASTELSDYPTALEHWVEIYQTADDKRIKKIAANHIYRVSAAIHIESLAKALAAFRERFGRNPSALSELVTAGIVTALPRDMDGNDYVYDPDTGAITTAVPWWKR